MITPVVQKWVLIDHLCRDCGGRILLCVEGNGMTPGGNQIRRCADCGKSGTQVSGADAICWCGTHHRGSNVTPYKCLPFSILESQPWLEEAFRACGCDPARGDVGIVLEADIGRLRNNKTLKPTRAEEADQLVKPLREWLEHTRTLKGRDRTYALDALEPKIKLLEWHLKEWGLRSLESKKEG